MSNPPGPRLSAGIHTALRPNAGPQTATAAREGTDVSAEVTVTDVDRIGVVVERVRFQGGTDSIHTRAKAIAAHIRPDGRPLVPIEVDARLGGATLRSPPDAQHRFYEADVTEHHLDLTRKQVGPEGERTPLSFPLTRSQLDDLLDQIEDALAPRPPLD